MADAKVHDVVMIGAGPSALSAAVYTAREDLDTLIIEKAVIGGMAALTDHVDNYPGFVEGIGGLQLAQAMEGQAERFGAVIAFGEVVNITSKDKIIKIQTKDDGDFFTKSALIATGTHYRMLNVAGEKEFFGRGVHFCATCDGAFYRDKNIIVVGGGNSALQEGIFLTKFAKHIDLLVRGDQMRASAILQDDLKKYIDSGQITVHYNTEITEIIGVDNKITEVKTNNKKQGSLKTDGVFVFIGLLPNTGFLASNQLIKLDDYGFIITDSKLQTGLEGVFASGDCRSGATMQIASATGEGASAALFIREYLGQNHKK